MKINQMQLPKSSFLAMEKDLNILIDLFLKNNRLKKLLYYTTPDCLDCNSLNEEQSVALFGKNIKIVPKLNVDKTVLNYIILRFDNFIPSGNPEFRDSMIEIDIICHFNQWQLKDMTLRPYKIAAEIDSMLDHRDLTNIGQLEFMGASQMVLTDEFGGLCLLYKAIHGIEDQKDAPNQKDNEDLINNFNQVINNR